MVLQSFSFLREMKGANQSTWQAIMNLIPFLSVSVSSCYCECIFTWSLVLFVDEGLQEIKSHTHTPSSSLSWFLVFSATAFVRRPFHREMNESRDGDEKSLFSDCILILYSVWHLILLFVRLWWRSWGKRDPSHQCYYHHQTLIKKMMVCSFSREACIETPPGFSLSFICFPFQEKTVQNHHDLLILLLLLPQILFFLHHKYLWFEWWNDKKKKTAFFDSSFSLDRRR